MEARVGVTKVPDPRLDALAKIFEPPKVTHATLEYLDFPAISKEALCQSRLSRQPARRRRHRARRPRLSTIRRVPTRKATSTRCAIIEDVDFELILSDLVRRRKASRAARKGTQEDQETRTSTANSNFSKSPRRASKPTNHCERWELNGDDEKRLRGFQFLSQKPITLSSLISAKATPRACTKWKRSSARNTSPDAPGPTSPPSAARIEAELAELSREEAKELLASYGLPDSGLDRLISATYRLLGLMSFLTAGETEVRAWTIPIHSTAVKAAGAIHSDFEKKFIRAEVVNWQATRRPQRLPRSPRKRPAPPRRQRIHRQGRRRPRHPPRVMA